jgi:prepilin signal peptidase PulO-like enzyme (type II secretory pathway)
MLSFIIIKIIIPALFGLLLGNYTTTVYYRLPHGKPINGLSKKYGMKPHCSYCGHQLKFYEYLPLLSWIFTRFKCNYCSAEIDKTYTFLEITGMVISVFFAIMLDMTYYYIAITCLWISYILIMVLYLKYKKIYYKIVFIFILLILASFAANYFSDNEVRKRGIALFSIKNFIGEYHG